MPPTLIDSHVHLYPPEVNGDPAGWAAAAGETHWARLCTRVRRDGRPVQAFPSLGELLEAMDGAGVDRAVLLGWYWQTPEACSRQNRFYAGCVRAHPDRLSACATIHPVAGREATLEEVRRAAAEGLVGLGELSPHAQGYSTSDPVFQAVLCLAAELGLPVCLHVEDPQGRSYPGKIGTPLEDFEALARQASATTFILAHWGGLLPLRRPGAGVLANLFYDTAASPLLYDGGVWRRVREVVGLDRILFGSDFPLDLYPAENRASPGMDRWVAEARGGLTERERPAVLGGTASRLFRIKAPPPGSASN